jgi:hypothetical protein
MTSDDDVDYEKMKPFVAGRQYSVSVPTGHHLQAARVFSRPSD